MPKITSVIDIGSNSVRMAIFHRTSRFGFYLLHEVKSKVRISEGCYENNGILQEVPMRRALRAIKNFIHISKLYKSKKLFCVATSATRDAPNSKEFIARVKKECGVNIKVIDGQKEAFFGGVACANLLHKKDGITLDIGGGSSECAYIQNGKIKSLVSLNIGTIRIKELFFDKQNDVKGAIRYINKELENLPAEFTSATIFGVGGTIRSIAKAIIKKENHNFNRIHGFTFEFKKQLDFIDAILNANSNKRLEELGLPKDRFDVIKSGALIFKFLAQKIRAREIIASGVGVREGVFLADILRNQNNSFPPNFNVSLTCLHDRFGSELSSVMRFYALGLFDTLIPLHKCDERVRFLLSVSAKIYDIGNTLNFYQQNIHSAYMLFHSLEYGFSHIDRIIISAMVYPKMHSQETLKKYGISTGLLGWGNYILRLSEALLKSISSKRVRFELSDFRLKVFADDDLYLAFENIEKLSAPNPRLRVVRG